MGHVEGRGCSRVRVGGEARRGEALKGVVHALGWSRIQTCFKCPSHGSWDSEIVHSNMLQMPLTWVLGQRDRALGGEQAAFHTGHQQRPPRRGTQQVQLGPSPCRRRPPSPSSSTCCMGCWSRTSKWLYVHGICMHGMGVGCVG